MSNAAAPGVRALVMTSVRLEDRDGGCHRVYSKTRNRNLRAGGLFV